MADGSPYPCNFGNNFSSFYKRILQFVFCGKWTAKGDPDVLELFVPYLYREEFTFSGKQLILSGEKEKG